MNANQEIIIKEIKNTFNCSEIVGSNAYSIFGYCGNDIDIMCIAETKEEIKEKYSDWLEKNGFKERDCPPYCKSIARYVDKNETIDLFFLSKKDAKIISIATHAIRTMMENTKRCFLLHEVFRIKCIRVAIFELIVLVIKSMDCTHNTDNTALNISFYKSESWRNKHLFDNCKTIIDYIKIKFDN